RVCGAQSDAEPLALLLIDHAVEAKVGKHSAAELSRAMKSDSLDGRALGVGDRGAGETFRTDRAVSLVARQHVRHPEVGVRGTGGRAAAGTTAAGAPAAGT